MKLSNDLISQFVKATKDTTTEKKTETTVYGTVVAKEGSDRYVRFDGANEDTHIDYKNIESTVEADVGDRVIVRIKNHTATIIGNTNPNNRSVGKTTATNIASDTANTAANATFNTLIVDYVKADELFGEQGRFTLLEADVVKINNTLVADYVKAETLFGEEGHITKLDSKVANIEKAYAKTADIEKLYAKSADVENLYAKKAEIEGVYAKSADVENIYAKKADIQDLESDVANIDELYAKKAEVNDLKAEVADIDTLIFGSATGNSIQASFANAVIAQLGNAQIKSAMIESVSADKITAGDVITNNVRVMSEDGRLLISDETIQISDDTRVRVQIGKDANGDYSINVWDTGGNLMFSEGGITDKAIKAAIIRNDMVATNANIHASKLDIDSLFEEINGSTNTIKSTQVKLDEKNQTLDVAFKSLETTVTGQGETISSQGTAISTIQGQIKSKVWQQDIDTAKSEMSTKYSTLEQEVDSFKTTVSETYATQTDVDAIDIGGRNLLLGSDSGVENANYGLMTYKYADPAQIMAGKEYTVSFDGMLSDSIQTGFYINTYPSPYKQCVIIPAISTDGVYHRYKATFKMPDNGSFTSLGVYSNTPGNGQVSGVKNIKLEKGNRATDWTLAPEDIDEDINAVQETANALITRVENAETTISQHTTAIDLRATRTEVATAKSEAISSANSNTANLLMDYSTTTQMNSAIQVTADSITSSVQESINGISVGGRNLLQNSEGVFAATEREFLQTGHDLYPIFAEHGLIEYTISMDMKSADITNADAIQVYVQNGSGSYHSFSKTFAVTTEWKRYSFTFIPTENTDFTDERSPLAFYGTYNTGNLPSVKNIKLEKGNKATDWTPAPEDMATAEEVGTAQATADEAGTVASNAETLVKQLSDSISTLVTDGNGTSLMTQTEDGWTFSTANIQNSVNGISENLHSLTTEVGDVNNAVDILQRAVDDLGVLAEYVAITTYNGEPCIELGEGDSDFKLRITNTQMMFSEGSTVLAYFTNQAFNSKKVVVEEELQQGGFVWKVRSNGNLGLTWKGGNS